MHNNTLVLRSDLIRPWANWVTPKEQPIRYDTAFFVAALPEGQQTCGDTREATSTGWFRPSTLLDGWRARKIGLMPPTWAQLKLLDTFRTVQEILDFSANISVDPVLAEPVDEPYMAEYYLMETQMYGTPKRHFAPGMKFAVDPAPARPPIRASPRQLPAVVLNSPCSCAHHIPSRTPSLELSTVFIIHVFHPC